MGFDSAFETVRIENKINCLSRQRSDGTVKFSGTVPYLRVPWPAEVSFDPEFDFRQRNFTYVVIFLDLRLKELIPNKFFYEWIQRDSMNVDREREMTFNCISQIKYTLNISDEIFKLSLEFKRISRINLADLVRLFNTRREFIPNKFFLRDERY